MFAPFYDKNEILKHQYKYIGVNVYMYIDIHERKYLPFLILKNVFQRSNYMKSSPLI